MVWSEPTDGWVATAEQYREEVGEGFTCEQAMKNAAYLAACDPQTVLALVEAVRALDELSRALEMMKPKRALSLNVDGALAMAREALSPFVVGKEEE
jgi:hypothetical protein